MFNRKKPTSLRIGASLILGGAFAGLLLAEITVRLIPGTVSPTLDYADIKEPNLFRPNIKLGGLLKPNLSTVVKGAFNEPKDFITNNEGFRYESEVLQKPNRSGKLVLSVGDSYAVGYRLAQTETYSHLIEKALQDKGLPVQIPIALTVEPAMNLHYLHRATNYYKPEVVLYEITLGNDLAQGFYALKNQFEFMPQRDGIYYQSSDQNYIAEKKSFYQSELPAQCINKDIHPNIQNDYQDTSFLKIFSLLKRAVAQRQLVTEPVALRLTGNGRTVQLFSNDIGAYLKEPLDTVEQSYSALFMVLDHLKALSIKNNFSLVIALAPQRFEVQPDDWKLTVQQYGLNPNCFDLKKPTDTSVSYCSSRGLDCINLAPPLALAHQESDASLYLPLGDMHWNEYGNTVVAAALAPHIESLLQ